MFTTKFSPWRFYLDGGSGSGDNGSGGKGGEGDKGSGGSGDQGAGGAAGSSTPAVPASFDDWFAALPDDQRKVAEPLLQARFTALENTVKATRKERDDAAKEMRILAAKAEKGSEAEKRLTEIAADFEAANKRADFYADAPSMECKNPRAAWAIATANDFFTRSGAVDWKALREAAPELFGKPQPKTNGGDGTGGNGRGSMTMNEYIRSKAGASPQ